MKVEWESGAQALFVELHPGDQVALESQVAAAPGTPLVGITADGARYQVKVRTCRKIGDGPLAYRIEGRLFNVTRAMRSALAAALPGPPSNDPETS